MLQDNWKHVIFCSFALLLWIYSGCQTKIDFITNTKNYCCICQFGSSFDTITLHQISMTQRKYVVIMVRSWKLFVKQKYLVIMTFWMKMLCILSKVKGNMIFLIWRMKYPFYFICKNLGKKAKTKIIVWRQCLFDFYLLKINKRKIF